MPTGPQEDIIKEMEKYAFRYTIWDKTRHLEIFVENTRHGDFNIEQWLRIVYKTHNVLPEDAEEPEVSLVGATLTFAF